MSGYAFHDEQSLSERAEELGKKAMEMGLIPSFSIHFFPDSRQFYLPNQPKDDFLTPEQAYMRLKKMVENAAQ